MSTSDRYERYAAWCKLLGVKPAEFDTWAREVGKITDFPAGYRETFFLQMRTAQ
jgi:hypothetical protein